MPVTITQPLRSCEPETFIFPNIDTFDWGLLLITQVQTIIENISGEHDKSLTSNAREDTGQIVNKNM